MYFKITYLNQKWKEEWGGQLTIERNGQQHSILPMQGRCVLFLSGVIDHQVHSTWNDRYGEG